MSGRRCDIALVSGLKINRPSQNYVGLFGYTDGATIRNVGLIDNKVTGKSQVGGLVGYAYRSNISNSYTTGSVTGNTQVGGLVGYAYSSTKITNSYTTGSVTGTGGQAGGLVGLAFNGLKISNSYWDKETTGQSTSAGGVGMTTDEMKTKATYKDWDFVNVWDIINGEYPKLK